MRLVRILDNYINDKKFSMIYTNGGIDIVNYSEILDFSSSKIINVFIISMGMIWLYLR